ncbi:MAG: FG-GAP repeat protein [Planctomycetota bacterium]
MFASIATYGVLANGKGDVDGDGVNDLVFVKSIPATSSEDAQLEISWVRGFKHGASMDYFPRQLVAQQQQTFANNRLKLASPDTSVEVLEWDGDAGAELAYKHLGKLVVYSSVTDLSATSIVFSSDGATNQQCEERLVAYDGAANDVFGNGKSGVAVDGPWAVVGAHHDDINSAIDQGSAYVYRLVDGKWTSSFKAGHGGMGPATIYSEWQSQCLVTELSSVHTARTVIEANHMSSISTERRGFNPR